MINPYQEKRLELSQPLKPYRKEAILSGRLTGYAIDSIVTARSNYPVANLVSFCEISSLSLVMVDLTTLDRFVCHNALEVHQAIALLMKRYSTDYKAIYRQTAKYYSAPETTGDDQSVASLSIDTLLAVCEALHCKLSIEPRRD